MPKVKTDACCARYNNFIYIFGGYDDTGNSTDTIYKFDCETETLSTLSATLPIDIYNGSAINYEKFIYIFFFKYVYKLDCETDTITTLFSDLNTSDYYFIGNSISMINNNAYLFYSNYITKFDCKTETLSKLSVNGIIINISSNNIIHNIII